MVNFSYVYVIADYLSANGFSRDYVKATNREMVLFVVAVVGKYVKLYYCVLPRIPHLSLAFSQLCLFCCEQISPSQFEAHAGMAARRQP